MGTVTVKHGSSVEISYQDAAIFHRGAAGGVLTDKAREFFELALQDLAGYISDEAPVGVSGSLAQSFAGSADGGREITGSSLADLTGRIFSSLPHAIVIDQGRTPGARMPPPAALETWVRRVLNVGGSEAEVRTVAWLVARSIGRNGIKARHFIEAGVSKWTNERADALWQAMADAMAAALVAPVEAGPGGVGL